MAVYYKFKSAKDYDSIPMDGHFISVANLKERIFESKHLGRGTDFDLVVTNAQTNEEYLDEAMLIPKNTSVLIRRVPGRPRMPIVTQPDELMVDSKIEDNQPVTNNFIAVDSSVLKDLEAPEWDDDFGNDLYATIPEMKPAHMSDPVQDAAPPSKVDEDSKIKALIETPALDWQRQAEGFGPGRGYGRGGRMMGGRGFGRGGLERKTPPQGYVCHRCKVPGHFIQHCPTNGDPNYDIKKVKPPTGIPKSMLMATPDGSYALPSGAAAVLKPNEAAFDKEMEGLPTSRPMGDLPPELHCPLCKEVMKDAVLTSKCCFTSFCDQCIRDHIISKAVCVCGAKDILADDLLPNKTLRDTINRILESNDVSAENAGSAVHIPDMESARPKAPSPTQSAASKGDQIPPPPVEVNPRLMEIADERPAAPHPPQQSQMQNQLTTERVKSAKVPDVSEATHESASAREAASQGSAPPPVEEEVQQKMAAGEGKKKKKKKARLPVNSMPMEMQWRNPQDFAAENYMMQMGGPSPYNPYWGGMQPGMDMAPPFPACPMPYNNMGFGMGPMDVPFGGMVPHDPFMGQNLMFPPPPPPFVPPPPQRDLADFSMGFNPRPPLMSREEFEARKADLRRKREMERLGDSREMPRVPKDRDHGREVSSSAVAPPMKPKPVPKESSDDRYDRERDRHQHGGLGIGGYRSERISPSHSRPDPPDHLTRPPAKRKLSSDHHSTSHHRSPSPDAFDHRDSSERRHHHRSSSKPPSVVSEQQLPPSLPHKSSSSSAAVSAAGDKKLKGSVFSRISFPEGGTEPSNKKRKTLSSSDQSKPSLSKVGLNAPSLVANGGHAREDSPVAARKSQQQALIQSRHREEVDYESSDDDRHFKRRPSRYEPSPPPRQEAAASALEGGRRSKRDRDHRGGHGSRHRSN